MEGLNYSFTPPLSFLHLRLLSLASSIPLPSLSLLYLFLSHPEFIPTPLMLAAQRPVKNFISRVSENSQGYVYHRVDTEKHI